MLLTEIHPKLPMHDKARTKDFYLNHLGFKELGGILGFDDYLMVKRDNIELHFFAYKDLDTKDNYGQVYIRTNDIEQLYQSMLDNKVNIHPAGYLQVKPWGEQEFALLDPDNNLLTFGQRIE